MMMILKEKQGSWADVHLDKDVLSSVFVPAVKLIPVNVTNHDGPYRAVGL